MFFESALKSGFGTVADALGYGAKADAAFDQSGRNLHSPAPEILDGRLSGKAREPLGQSGA